MSYDNSKDYFEHIHYDQFSISFYRKHSIINQKFKIFIIDVIFVSNTIAWTYYVANNNNI